jgi:hypothetical protein
MKNPLSKEPAEAAGSFEFGAIIGQRQAFGLIAGRCSAAESRGHPAHPGGAPLPSQQAAME